MAQTTQPFEGQCNTADVDDVVILQLDSNRSFKIATLNHQVRAPENAFSNRIKKHRSYLCVLRS